MKPKNSTRTITFDTPLERVTFASMSPDFRRVAITGWTNMAGHVAYVLDPRISGFRSFGCQEAGAPWFPPGDERIWSLRASGPAYWILGIGCPDQFRSLADTEQAPQGCPWVPSHGYKVTCDWWILGPDGKRLLMLPPPWQSDVGRRVWSGQFLALLHGSLPEPVILNLGP